MLIAADIIKAGAKGDGHISFQSGRGPDSILIIPGIDLATFRTNPEKLAFTFPREMHSV
jgi:hypothetical protein